jgi:hypothetical protein
MRPPVQKAFGPRGRQVVILLIAVIAGVLAWWIESRIADRLLYVEVDGVFWDRDGENCTPMSIRVEDQRALADLQRWRRSRDWFVTRQALSRLFSPRRSWCENALRQPLERVTLVYTSGRTEQDYVNVDATPLRAAWEEALDDRRSAAASAAAQE